MKIAIFWFRRDLRLSDNAALYHALQSGYAVLPVFIFDTQILNALQDRSDRRVNFIYETLTNLRQELEKMGSTLYTCYGSPLEMWDKITQEFDVAAVYTNHDYEPYAKLRDEQVASFLAQKNITFHTYKDQCIFEKNEVVKDDGKPYTIFTPYSKKWKARLTDDYLKSYPTEKYFANFYAVKNTTVPLSWIPLEAMNFQAIQFDFPTKNIEENIIRQYAEKRDFPAVKGTTRLSVHLRFGTVSIRALARIGNALNEKWLNELIWRDFYMMILWHFPHVVHQAFKPQYDKVQWRNNEKEFEAWCKGQTGYPIVDAGMRELNATGFMHNRVRMITASFLVKHLLIDWRWGEAYFAEKLLDFDLSANNGSWQWAASSGCDAAPYFRVFNPLEQTKKFDGQLQYIKKWVPEFNSFSYVRPIVEHKFARERVLKVYKTAVGSNEVVEDGV
jgi:deoxyribodipyrimidine photo-lyase